MEKRELIVIASKNQMSDDPSVKSEKPYYFKCPRCGNQDHFSKVREDDSSLGCLLLLLGGVIPALLYASHKSGQVQCRSCSQIFSQPQLRSTGTQKCATWITMLIIVPLFIGGMIAVTGSNDVLPAIDQLKEFEALIAASPRVVLYYTIFVLPLILSVLMGMHFIGGRNFKKAVKQDYCLSPPPQNSDHQQNEG